MLHQLSPTERVIYVLLIAVGLGVAGFVGQRYLQKPTSIVFESKTSSSETAKTAKTEISVHVAGAVKQPGVYTFPPDARVKDAIDQAGGPSDSADLDQVNLAAILEDGTQLYVPEADAPTKTASDPKYQGGSLSKASNTYSKGSTSDKKAKPEKVISINSASLQELQRLPGIGPVTAQSIIDYRNNHGPFKTVDALLAVRGIGPKKLEKMRSYLKL